MKKYLFSIVLACLTLGMQAEEMWHIVGTNDYARKQCLSRIGIYTDTITGAAYYFNNLPQQAGETDLPEMYSNVFNRFVQSGSMMPTGNGDIRNMDEGLATFYRLTWSLNEFPADGGWWIWYDLGIPELQQCDWNDNNSYVTSAYIRLLYNLTLQNTYLHVADSLNLYPAERLQVRFVRALTAWYMLDLFPASHFTTTPRIDGNTLVNRRQLYSWLENELLALTTALPSTRTDIYHVDADAAKMLLARLYLNAEVYTGTPQWEKASQYALQVMNGHHPLHATTTSVYSPYQELFMGDNDANGAEEEVLLMLKQDGNSAYSYGGAIFAIAITRNAGMPSWGISEQWRCWRAGYRLLQAFATDEQLQTLKGTEYTMPALLGDDRAMFYADDTYTAPALTDLYNGNFTDTWSVNKFTARYSTDPMDGSSWSNSSPQWPDTDLPLMRSAEAWLTYAEAQFRLGNTTEARNTIAALRNRANASTPNTITLDYILDEWLREFYSEGRRRVDLVRFNQFAGATATRTWEGHTAVTNADFNTFPTPDLLKEFPRFDNKVRYFAFLVQKQNGEWDPENGWQCDSCNTGETYYDAENNTSYSVNYNSWGFGQSQAFSTGYPVEPTGPLELELTEFPYMQQPELPQELPAVTPQENAFIIMLHCDADYGNNLVVLGDYLNASGEWIYSDYRLQPQNHTVSGTTRYNQNFARFESVGDGWYKAVVYPLMERDSNPQTHTPGAANISGIAYYPQGASFNPVTVTGIHKAGGVVMDYTENSTGEMSFAFTQTAYYNDDTYGRIYYHSMNTDRVVYLSVEGWEIPEQQKLPAVEGTAGAVTVVIKFDEQPMEGYDILFVGAYKSSSWDFSTAQSMTPIGDGWYKIVLFPDDEGTITGRPIQGSGDDVSWNYDWSHNSSDIIAIQGVEDYMLEPSGYGETNLRFYSSDTERAAVVYLECKQWYKTPSQKVTFTITVQLPDFCEPFDTEIIGSFGNWDSNKTVPLQKLEGNTYQAVVNARENDEWKIRGVGDWDYQVLYYNENNGTWDYPDNYAFGSNHNIVMDLSDPSKYKWSVCAE